MAKSFIFKQISLLFIVSTIIILSNVVRFGGTIMESVTGVAILCTISFVGIIVSKIVNRFVKLPTVMFVSLIALLVASPISPIRDTVISLTANVATTAPTTALGAFAGISLGKDLKEFSKMGWKLVVITLFVITGTFLGSAIIAHVVLNLMGTI